MGAIRHDTVLNAIVYRFGGPVTGPILQIPPTALPLVPAPVPVQAADDGVNPPTISPLGTLSAQPFGDQSDARWVVGLPNGALAPSLANSVFHFEPNLAAGTTTLTVKPFVGGAVGTTWIIDLPNAGTTTLSVLNSTVGQVADLTVDGTVQGLTGVQGGTAGAQVLLSTVGGVPTIGTSAATDLNIAPAGGDTTVTGTLTATGILTGQVGLQVGTVNIGLLEVIAGVTTLSTTAGNIEIDSVGGTTTIDDALVVAGSVSPSGVARDLGSAAALWREAFLSVGIESAGSLSIDMVNAAATTLTITNGGVGRGNLDVDQQIRFEVGSGGLIGSLLNLAGVPALTSSGSVGLASNAGVGGDFIIFLGNISHTGNQTSSGTITGTTLNGTTGINTGAGAGTLRITSAGVTNNLDMDGGAAGNLIRLKFSAAPGGNRAISFDENNPGVSGTLYILGPGGDLYSIIMSV